MFNFIKQVISYFFLCGVILFCFIFFKILALMIFLFFHPELLAEPPRGGFDLSVLIVFTFSACCFAWKGGAFFVKRFGYKLSHWPSFFTIFFVLIALFCSPVFGVEIGAVFLVASFLVYFVIDVKMKINKRPH